MARIKIPQPSQYTFSTSLVVRITDINYGGHAGNDAILSMIHEARMRFLAHHGYSELDIAGVGMIMGDVAIEFKGELFYGETVIMNVTAGEFSRVGFDIFYKFEKETAGKTQTVVLAKTGMVCFNYSERKVVSVPEIVITKLTAVS
jgi:acyl-CoA thioester hydrolase